MFRIGGSANDGIMSMAAPRRNYQEGSPREQRIMPRGEENVRLLEKFLGQGRSVSSDLGDLLISGGLNLLSGRGAGKGTLGAIAESYKDPYASFAKARANEEALKRQIRLTGATQALSSDEALELAKLKYGMEAGKEQEQRKKELMQQYQLNYSEANTFQSFLNSANEIGRKIGLPVQTAPLTLTFKKGKFEIPGAKNMPEGIYYDPRNNKYIKIHSGTPIIGDTIAEILKPVVAQQKKIITKEEFPSFDASSP
jgi:hypothetical protein